MWPGQMSSSLTFSQNAFKNGPAFVAELEAMLRANINNEVVVQRVIGRTVDAYANLQRAIFEGRLPAGDMERIVRYALFSDDFKALQMKLLSTLISSFIALETPVAVISS
jgi:hypothetical protein